MKRIFVLLLAILVSFQTMAAALPSYSPKFGNAMAGVVQQKVAARGFAANDPRFVATEAAIGTVLTGAATGLAAAAGLPLWATIGIGAVAAGAVALGVGALTNWIFNNDSTVTGQSTMPNLGTGGVTAGGGYYSADDGTQTSDPVAAANAEYAYLRSLGPSLDGYPFSASVISCSPSTGGTSFCSMTGWYSASNYHPASQNYWNPPANQGVPWHSSGARGTCPTGQVSRAGGCGLVDPLATPTTPTPKKISDAVADVPTSDMALPANPDLVAQAVNKAWQQAAAQPGYQGLPYIASDPVTSGDVNNWKAANPGTYPSVGDMLAPAVNPGTSTVPQPVAPGTVASPGTATAPAGTPQVNLGTDPVIAPPTLESTPTAQMILNPLLNLFPDLKTFVVPSHSAECPKPSASIFGRTVMMDGHCTLLEPVRSTLYAVMAAVWVMIALFIILAA